MVFVYDKIAYSLDFEHINDATNAVASLKWSTKHEIRNSSVIYS